MKKLNRSVFVLAVLVLALTATMKVAGASQPIVGPSTYEPYTFTTLAGNADYGSDDGSGSAARFWYPIGVAVDSVGNVYVADIGNNAIRKVTPDGVVTTLAGLAQFDARGNPVGGYLDGTGSAARFNSPVGVAVDNTGNVYVADRDNNTIRKVTPQGVVTTLAGNSSITNQLGEPLGGYADGIGSAARFANPYGVAVDGAGNVYVADAGNYTIRKVTPQGVVTTLTGLGGSAIAVDSAGKVYVADSLSYAIRKVTPEGVVTTLAGGIRGSVDGTGSDAGFFYPIGVAVDSASNVYVAESGDDNCCFGEIRKVTPAGAVTTLAGLAGSVGSADGTGNQARFNRPFGVAVDSAGNVYVADSANNTIRKGYPTPRILNSGSGFGFNGGQFGFNLAGPSGKSVVVEASTDLVTWLPLWTNTFTFPAPLNFSDPQSGVSSKRFYRAFSP